MKLFTFFIVALLTFSSFGQGNGEIVIFSSTGEPVYVVLNGVRQNYQPETNLRISDLMANWYKCRIEAYNNSFEIDKNIIVKKDTLITYQVKESNGKYKLSFYTEVPLKSAPVQPDQNAIVYHVTELENPAPATQSNTEVTTITTTTTTNTQTQVDPVNSGSVNININVSETGMNTDMQVVDPVTNETVTMDVDVNATGMSNNTNVNVQETTGNYTYSETTTITTTTNSSTHVQQNEVNGNVVTNSNPQMGNCVVDAAGMENVVEAVNNESFSDNKKRVAKQFIKTKCLTVNQIKELVELFSFSADMMEIAKYAYDFCINKDDYYLLINVFTFSADKEELEQFIESK